MSDHLKSPHLAVIVINYGTADLTIDAVESVLKFYRGDPSVEIHVVDNATPGDDAAVLKQAHAARKWDTQVTFHLEVVNHGFGKGNNVVLRQLAARGTPPEFVFLLNPDARLKNDAISMLCKIFERHPRTGFAGAGIWNVDGSKASAAFRFPSRASTLVEAVNFGPVARIWRRRHVSLSPNTPSGCVDWVSGAAVMMRFSTLEEIGFFDPDFFLYFEEVEIMHRAAAHFWETRYVPEAGIIHMEGAATGIKKEKNARSRKPVYWYQSWGLYFQKTSGRRGAILAGFAWITGVSINYVIAFLRRQLPHAPLRFYRDFWTIVFLPLLTDKLPIQPHDHT